MVTVHAPHPPSPHPYFVPVSLVTKMEKILSNFVSRKLQK